MTAEGPTQTLVIQRMDPPVDAAGPGLGVIEGVRGETERRA
jgi:hypothetical protein